MRCRSALTVGRRSSQSASQSTTDGDSVPSVRTRGSLCATRRPINGAARRRSIMARRAHGDGTLYARKDGRFEAIAELGRDEKGKRQRLSVYGRTRREVTQKLKVAQREHDAGLRAGDGNEALGPYLT